MSSGDPLVDQEAQHLEALNKMLDSLASKDELVLEAAQPADGGDDPLVDAEEEARKKRDELLDSLAGKGDNLLATKTAESDDPMLADDKERESERDQLVQQLQNSGDALLAQEDVPDPQTVEEALQAMNNYADTSLLTNNRPGNSGGASTSLEANEPSADADANGFLPDSWTSWFKKDKGDEKGEQQLEENANAGASSFSLPDVKSWTHWFKKDDTTTAPQLMAATQDRPPHPGFDDAQSRRRRKLEAEEQERRRRTLEADGQDRRRNVLEADGQDRRRRVLEADGQERRRVLESDGAEKRIWRRTSLAANTDDVHASAMDLPQVFGGAFLLVAVIALVAVVRRRRKSAAPAPVDDAPLYDHDYQAFL